MMKSTYTCDPGTETFMEMLVTHYSAKMANLILKQVGVVPTTKLTITLDGFTKEINYHVTMDALEKINEKGFKYLGQQGLKIESDRIMHHLAELVGKDVQIDPNTKQKCSDCGKEKYLTEFYKNKTKKLGVNNICKECQKERNWKRTTEKSIDEE